MRASDNSAQNAAPQSEGLQWPAPVSDTDILWLEPEEAALSTPAASADVKTLAATSSVATSGNTAVASPALEGLPLQRLLASGVSFEWHDAVAIVLAIAEQVAPDPARPPSGAVPDLESIVLRPDGRFDVRLDRNRSESIVAGFGRLLHRLLQDKPAPANLRLLAWQATSDAAAAVSFQQLTHELTRWERPGRPAKLVDLYTRGKSAPIPVAPRPPVVEAIEPPPAPAREPEPSAAPKPRRKTAPPAAVAAAVASAVLAGGLVWIAARGGDSASVVTVADGQDVLLERDAVAGRAAVRNNNRPADIPRRDTAQSTRAASRRTPTGKRDARSTRAASSVASRTAKSGEETLELLDVAAPRPTPGNRRAAEPPMYGYSDAGVTEPILVKPRLPLRPGPNIPENALSVLELVVDERGAVETVRLKSPANRYREKWWLFTAKTWRFDPARKDGRPVKFLKRILLTDLNLAEPQ
jgi:hypothetical protein